MDSMGTTITGNHHNFSWKLRDCGARGRLYEARAVNKVLRSLSGLQLYCIIKSRAERRKILNHSMK